MIASGGSPTPPGVVFYDRLVFDGTAYIDTDITIPTDASFRITVGGETAKSAQRVFGIACANSGGTSVILSGQTNNTKRVVNAYYQSYSAVSSKDLAWTYEQYTIVLTPKRFGFGNSTDLITKGSDAFIGGIVFGSTGTHSGNPFTGKMGESRIYGSEAQNATGSSELWNDYTPVFTFKPCTYNGNAGMWCVETSTFYGNSAGSGSLTVQNI